MTHQNHLAVNFWWSWTSPTPSGRICSLLVLGKCNQGIDLNLIAFQHHTHIYRSDSCVAGLGGYSQEGFAWRFYIPDDVKFLASDNLLKHIAAIITPWIDVFAGWLKESDCTLLMTNSTILEGWLRKSNFIEDGKDPIQVPIWLKVACLHATHYLSNGIRKYSQWFCGASNNVANALSQDNGRTDNELTQILFSHCPSQLLSWTFCYSCPSNSSWWKHTQQQNLGVESLLQVL